MVKRSHSGNKDNIVKEGHWRSLRIMNSDKFIKIKNVFGSSPFIEIFGGVYFRPIDEGVRPVELSIHSNKALMGIGEKCILTRDTKDSVYNSMSERIDILQNKKAHSKAKGKEKNFEAWMINNAQSNKLKIKEFSDVNQNLRFIHSQWRVPDLDNINSSEKSKVTDLIAVDIEKKSLVIIELKYKKELDAFSQVEKYMKYFKENADQLIPFFSELSKIMGKLYNCKELEELDELNNEIYGIVAWPKVEDVFEDLFVESVNKI